MEIRIVILAGICLNRNSRLLTHRKHGSVDLRLRDSRQHDDRIDKVILGSVVCLALMQVGLFLNKSSSCIFLLCLPPPQKKIGWQSLTHQEKADAVGYDCIRYTVRRLKTHLICIFSRIQAQRKFQKNAFLFTTNICWDRCSQFIKLSSK